MSKPIIIYSDGACSGNPGPGGWASILLDENDFVVELCGKVAATTNNRMEICASLEALREIKSDTASVIVYTDSKYLIQGITAWIFGWKRNGWMNSQGNPVENKDLWEELSLVVNRIGPKRIQWNYIPGHAGIEGNERCDELAVSASQGTIPTLYQGALTSYPITLREIPQGVLPSQEIKSSYGNKPKIAAYYLSYVHGKLYKDSDWKSCEARVKGVRGAKFKKCTSDVEEAKILSDWGVPKSFS